MKRHPCLSMACSTYCSALFIKSIFSGLIEGGICWHQREL
ncbi:hypothetical protein PTUN_a1504 [Pseudoalteromonas tunicata]|nr:hypothetical protein PTUN_a1504 [Pseudoalteromonas tunicata]